MPGFIAIPIDIIPHILALMLLCIGCLIWHTMENKAYRRQFSTLPLTPKERDRLMKLLWNRSMQLWVVLAAAAIVIGVYDWKLNVPATPALPALPQTAEAASAAALTPSSGIPAESPAISASEQLAELFDEENPKGKSAALDTLKKRYEELFINYLLLSRCGLATTDDYHVLNSALARDLASVSGPARLQYDIWTAAQGSYRELYAKAVCSNEQTLAQSAPFRAYIEALRKQAPTS